jgi:6-phospho-beta-glucosidase
MIRTFTVVGGGSAYVPGLVSALIHHRRSLSLQRVRLYDIHHENLEIVARLTSRMAEAEGAGFQITAHTELLDALSGCDAVLNTSRPGGLECRRIDETLPLELGIPGQETVGPGGFFFALRSVPAALLLARALERTAPHAILLNYTNPTNVVTQAISERARLSVIGLCDQSEEDLHDLCRSLGAPPIFDFAPVGLNHAVWYQGVKIGGTPLEERLARIEVPADLTGEYRLRFELARELAKDHPGSWPSSYLPYYYWPDRFVAQARADGPRADTIARRLPDYFAHFREEAAKERPELRHHRGTHGFGDLAVRVLTALVQPIATSIVLDVPNFAAAASDFSASTVVETASYVSSAGIIRRAAPRVPEDQRPLLLRLERYQRAAAEAAATQDPRAAADALAENPLIPSRRVAEQMLERAKVLYGSAIPMLA